MIVRVVRIVCAGELARAPVSLREGYHARGPIATIATLPVRKYRWEAIT